jgi:hypothetical protein
MATLQSPSVGAAARFEVMHGQRKLQLQVSMYFPLIFQPAIFTSLKGTGRVREGYHEVHRKSTFAFSICGLSFARKTRTA